MSETFERYRRSFAEADLAAFEALCFHQAETVAEPYARLLKAPSMRDSLVALALVERARESSAQAIHTLTRCRLEAVVRRGVVVGGQHRLRFELGDQFGAGCIFVFGVIHSFVSLQRVWSITADP